MCMFRYGHIRQGTLCMMCVVISVAWYRLHSIASFYWQAKGSRVAHLCIPRVYLCVWPWSQRKPFRTQEEASNGRLLNTFGHFKYLNFMPYSWTNSAKKKLFVTSRLGFITTHQREKGVTDRHKQRKLVRNRPQYLVAHNEDKAPRKLLKLISVLHKWTPSCLFTWMSRNSLVTHFPTKLQNEWICSFHL